MKTISKSKGTVIKKALAVICLLCLLLSFGAVTASAQGEARIIASSCTAERGGEASVSFSLENNPGIWGIKLRIHYDHSGLTLNSVTTGAIFNESEFLMSGNLNKDPYVVTAYGDDLVNKTSTGTIFTMNFTVNSKAEIQSYSVTTEVSQVNNVDGETVSASAGSGSISVVECMHLNKEWKVSAAAECEKSGTETLACKKCGETFETRAIKATGHKHTEIKNAVAATNTVDGYTGDTYCKDCGKLISKGKAIAKLKKITIAAIQPISSVLDITEPSEDDTSVTTPIDTTEPTSVNEPKITSGSNLIYYKNSDKPLVFISDTDFSEFIRVEIDNETLFDEDFSVESSSATITVKPEFLNKLSNGVHTFSVVSESGTANTEFTVQNELSTTVTETVMASENISDNTEPKASAMPIIILVVVVIVVLLAGGTITYFLSKKRR